MTPHPAELHASHSPRANRIFWIKSRLLMARRVLRNLGEGETYRRYRRAPLSPDAALLGRDEHRVYSATDPRERELEMGKVQNLRVAAAAVDGSATPAEVANLRELAFQR